MQSYITNANYHFKKKSKIENKRPLLKFYEEFDRYPARPKEERIVKNIHKFQKLKDELSIILFYNPAFTSLHTTRTATLKNAQNNHSVSNSDVVCSCLFSERMTKSFCNGKLNKRHLIKTTLIMLLIGGYHPRQLQRDRPVIQA